MALPEGRHEDASLQIPLLHPLGQTAGLISGVGYREDNGVLAQLPQRLAERREKFMMLRSSLLLKLRHEDADQAAFLTDELLGAKVRDIAQLPGFLLH
ncbi:hypothetical protein D3C73_1481880 [compost metagenome]